MQISSNYRCLKLYCQCFALSSTCGPKCKCQTCHNTTLHAEAIKEARKNILERNPNAFDDKFRGSPTSSPFRPGLSPAISSWQPVYSHGSPPSQVLPLNQKPSRVNKFGCKCRRSFCLKKVRFFFHYRDTSCCNDKETNISLSFLLSCSIVNVTKMMSIVVHNAGVKTARITRHMAIHLRRMKNLKFLLLYPRLLLLVPFQMKQILRQLQQNRMIRQKIPWQSWQQ